MAIKNVHGHLGRQGKELAQINHPAAIQQDDCGYLKRWSVSKLSEHDVIMPHCGPGESYRLPPQCHRIRPPGPL